MGCLGRYLSVRPSLCPYVRSACILSATAPNSLDLPFLHLLSLLLSSSHLSTFLPLLPLLSSPDYSSPILCLVCGAQQDDGGPDSHGFCFLNNISIGESVCTALYTLSSALPYFIIFSLYSYSCPSYHSFPSLSSPLTPRFLLLPPFCCSGAAYALNVHRETIKRVAIVDFGKIQGESSSTALCDMT